MTLIIWMLEWDKISIHWDRRTHWWHIDVRNDAVKITRLWDTLFGSSWDYIWMSLIREIYDKWSTDKEYGLNLHSLIWIQSFVSTIKENTLLKEVEMSYIFMNEDIQISIMSQWYIEEALEFTKDKCVIVIWSWSNYAVANYATQLIHKWSIDIDEIFSVCNRFVSCCSKEYDSLYLN